MQARIRARSLISPESFSMPSTCLVLVALLSVSVRAAWTPDHSTGGDQFAAQGQSTLALWTQKSNITNSPDSWNGPIRKDSDDSERAQKPEKGAEEPAKRSIDVYKSASQSPGQLCLFADRPGPFDESDPMLNNLAESRKIDEHNNMIKINLKAQVQVVAKTIDALGGKQLMHKCGPATEADITNMDETEVEELADQCILQKDQAFKKYLKDHPLFESQHTQLSSVTSMDSCEQILAIKSLIEFNDDMAEVLGITKNVCYIPYSIYSEGEEAKKLLDEIARLADDVLNQEIIEQMKSLPIRNLAGIRDTLARYNGELKECQQLLAKSVVSTNSSRQLGNLSSCKIMLKNIRKTEESHLAYIKRLKERYLKALVDIRRIGAEAPVDAYVEDFSKANDVEQLNSAIVTLEAHLRTISKERNQYVYDYERAAVLAKEMQVFMPKSFEKLQGPAKFRNDLIEAQTKRGKISELNARLHPDDRATLFGFREEPSIISTLEESLKKVQSLIVAIKEEHALLVKVLPESPFKIAGLTSLKDPQPVALLQQTLDEIVGAKKARAKAMHGEIIGFYDQLVCTPPEFELTPLLAKQLSPLLAEHTRILPLAQLIKKIKAVEGMLPGVVPFDASSALGSKKYEEASAQQMLQRRLAELEEAKNAYTRLVQEINALAASLQVNAPLTFSSVEKAHDFKSKLEECKRIRAELKSLNGDLHPKDQVNGAKFGDEEAALKTLQDRVQSLAQFKELIEKERAALRKVFEYKNVPDIKARSISLEDTKLHLEEVVEAKRHHLQRMRTTCLKWKQELQDDVPTCGSEDGLVLEYQDLRQRMRHHHTAKFIKFGRSAAELGIQVQKLVSGDDFDDGLILESLRRLEAHTAAVQDRVKQCKDILGQLDTLNAKLWWTKLVYHFPVSEDNVDVQEKAILGKVGRARRLIHYERAVLILLTVLVLATGVFCFYKFSPWTSKREKCKGGEDDEEARGE